MQRNRIVSSIFGLALLLTSLGGATAKAQTAVDGAIGGTVEDTSGGAIPEASVVVINKATNATQTVIADKAGVYRAIHLQPGEYTVTVKATGYGAFSSSDVTVQVGLLTALQPMLNVGAAADQVVVSGETPLINTVSPDFNQVISQVELKEIPVVNYRWSAYALQAPGVVEGGGFGLLSFRGQSTLLNNVTVDGADDNQAFFPDERGRTTTNYTIPKTSIQEFQINVSNYSSEYGRAGGGVVNSITKSGTNQFHGEGYFYDRDSAMAAQNDFTSKAEQLTPGSPVFTTVQFKPTDIRKQMGFGVGGPIVRNKLFFYFSMDDYYHYFPLTLVASSPNLFFATPSPTLPGAGTCAGISSSSSSPNYDPNYTADSGACTVQTNLKLPTYAAGVADFDAGLNGLNSLLGTVPRFASQTLFFPKVDWQINAKNHLSGEVNRLRFVSPGGQQTNTTASYGQESVGNIYVRDTWGIAKLDTFFTPNFSNEIRYQYGRDFNFAYNEKPTPYEQATLLNTSAGYTNPNGIPPAVSITNGFTFGTATFLNRPAYPDERRWQATDTANWQHGNHAIKFGIDYLHTYDLAINLTSVFGNYSYSSVANYVSDYYLSQNPATVAQANHYSSYAQGFGPLGFQFTTGDYAGFIQDDWKVAPRLSVTIGARYEYEQLPPPQLPNPLVPQTVTFPSDKNNIAPRVGFSYDLAGNGKTILRGGWGIFNARLENSTIYDAITQTGVAGGQNVASLTPTSAGAPTFPTILQVPKGQAAIPSVYYLDPHFQEPQIQQFDLSVQRDIGWHTVLSATYLGALGRELADFVDTNLPAATTVNYTVVDNNVANSPLKNGSVYSMPFYGYSTLKGAAAPTDNARPDTRFSSKTDIFSGVSSSYHALVLQVAHSFYHNLTFQGSYTWSHALDYGENDTTFASTNALLDPNNLRADYGNSNHNVPNRVIATAVATSPWHAHGWLSYLANNYTLSPSFSGQTGAPYSATISGSLPSTSSGPLENASGTGLIQGVSTSTLNGSGGENRLPGTSRNQFHYRDAYILDLSGSKTFTIHENYQLELKASSYNILNHQNVTSTNASAYTVSNIGGVNTLTAISGANSFGTVANSNNNNIYVPRQIQFEARFTF
jgi:hypothetical protein